MLVRLAFDELDAVVDQVRVEVLDLLLAELDILEPRGNLVVVEESFLETVLDKLLQFFDVGERDVDGQHVAATSGLDGGRGLDRPQEREKAGACNAGLLSRRRGYYTRAR